MMGVIPRTLRSNENDPLRLLIIPIMMVMVAAADRFSKSLVRSLKVVLPSSILALTLMQRC
jgi:hypothetical protein